MNHPTKTYVWWTGVAVALYNENIIIQLPYQTASLPPSAPPAARAVRTHVSSFPAPGYSARFVSFTFTNTKTW